MTWVRLSDTFVELPLWEQVGAEAAFLHLAALSYSNRTGTDGFVSRVRVASLTPVVRAHGRLAQKLVDAGLWIEHEDGFVIALYTDDEKRSDGRGDEQPLAARVQARRASNADRQARFRAARAAKQDSKKVSKIHAGNASGNALRNGSPNALQTRPGPKEPGSGSVEGPPTHLPQSCEHGRRRVFADDGSSSCATCDAADAAALLTGTG